MDEKRIEFLHIDANKYVQKAEGSNESYDLIIVTTLTQMKREIQLNLKLNSLLD
jgi:23S rRNA G2069 N7-methylase RlmK/C1962 C5-methylase RlmI